MHHEAVSGIKSPTNLQIDSDKYMSWKKWLQQFEWYVPAIQLEKKSDNIQIATFVIVIGQNAIEIYNSFNLNDTDKNNLQIVKERYILFKIEQNENEQFI